MARLSKPDFTVYDDSRTVGDVNEVASTHEDSSYEHATTDDFGHSELSIIEQYRKNPRRISAMTDDTISSIPDSVYPTDQEFVVTLPNSTTPQSSRRSYLRRPELKRAQISSPSPFERFTPRLASQRGLKSRAGTPNKSSKVRNSPLQRRAQKQHGDDTREYPLVLLHITLLPIAMPWSLESMKEILPARILENLQLLQCKANDTILSRGILIPHPREEYDLLEERLFEALDLQKERVTADGHFRLPRESDGSETSTVGGHSRHDSGLGSSEEEASDDERDICSVCEQHMHSPKFGFGTNGPKWNVRVYAANGLMKAAAWSACWSEMERVDVEVRPWIPDELRKRLDARLQEETQQRRQQDLEDDRIRYLVDEQIRLAQEERDQIMEVERLAREEEAARQAAMLPASRTNSFQHGTASCQPHAVPKASNEDLPQIYKRSQIPLSVLLRNYIYLLAQDRRNAIIFFLGILALYLGIHSYSSTLNLSSSHPNDEIAFNNGGTVPWNAARSFRSFQEGSAVLEGRTYTAENQSPSIEQDRSDVSHSCSDSGDIGINIALKSFEERSNDTSVAKCPRTNLQDELFGARLCTISK